MRLSVLRSADVAQQMASAIKSHPFPPICKLPSHMRAWQCLNFLDAVAGDITKELHWTNTRRLPAITRPDHLLVQVKMASLNPIDLMNLYGYGSTAFQYARHLGSMLNILGFSGENITMSVNGSSFPWTPGRDFLGTVVSCGPEATRERLGIHSRVLPGQRVVGATWPFLSSTGSGGLAQYLVCPASYVAELPPKVHPDQAAAIGYCGLTAWSALVTGGLHPRCRSIAELKQILAPSVLVTGATGGVGLIAAQLAKLSGARVHVTCPSDARAITMMKQLEVDDIIVHPDQPPMNTKYDLIIDCIRRRDNDSVLQHESPMQLVQNTLRDVAPLYTYLKPSSNSRYVNLNSPFLHMVDRLGLIAGMGATLMHWTTAPITLLRADSPVRLPSQLRWAFFQPSGYRLSKMLQWTAEGRIRLFVDSHFPFHRVPDAFARVQSRGVRGKVLIHIEDI